MRVFYAYQRPRGFINEVNVHGFEGRKYRDEWVSEHKDDGDVNSAALGAKKCTAREARQILCNGGYNQYVFHG